MYQNQRSGHCDYNRTEGMEENSQIVSHDVIETIMNYDL